MSPVSRAGFAVRNFSHASLRDELRGFIETALPASEQERDAVAAAIFAMASAVALPGAAPVTVAVGREAGGVSEVRVRQESEHLPTESDRAPRLEGCLVTEWGADSDNRGGTTIWFRFTSPPDPNPAAVALRDVLRNVSSTDEPRGSSAERAPAPTFSVGPRLS